MKWNQEVITAAFSGIKFGTKSEVQSFSRLYVGYIPRFSEDAWNQDVTKTSIYYFPPRHTYYDKV